LLFVLYVGTRRLAGVLAEETGGPLRILRIAEIQSADGFQKGEVAQLDRALHSVEELLKRLEFEDELFDIAAYLLLCGPQLKMTRFSSSIYYTGYPRVITPHEVRRVIAQTRAVAPLPLEDWILQARPESFWVNDLTDVEDPIGLEAQRLAVTLQIFTTHYASFRNLSRLLDTLELQIQGYFPKPLFLAEGVLNASEREGEVLVLDIADGVTHLVLTQEGRITQMKSLELGSGLLTRRISEKWQLSPRDAGNLKERFASLEEKAPFGEELIPLVERNGRPSHPIKRSEFHREFKCFGEEFFSELEKEVKNFLARQGASRPSLVVTGGGVKMEGALELLGRRFSFPMRMGTPRSLEGSAELLTDPGWAGTIGFLHWLGDHRDGRIRGRVRENPIGRTFLQFKDWLAAYF